MKRVLAALFGTVTGLVVLLNFKTHPVSVANPPVATTTTGNGTGSAGSAGSSGRSQHPSSGPGASSTSGPATSGPATSPKKSTRPSSSSGTKTYTGAAVDTQYGPVQVRITVTNGKLVSADAIVYPNEQPRDQEINYYAIPALEQEAVRAGSAQIDMISGATYTSEGYIQSLQSALDKMGR